MATFESAVYGNRAGSHQLLSSSLPDATPELDKLRFLVDRPAGHVGQEVKWSPYWGCEAVGRWWALWRGEEDSDAPRKNMVRARASLVPIDACGSLEDLVDLFDAVGGNTGGFKDVDPSLTGAVVDCLARGEGPAIILDLTVAPGLLRALWPSMWASARASLSLRTLFATDEVGSVSTSSIVVVPAELRTRWHGKQVIEQGNRPQGAASRWFTGKTSSRQSQLIRDNTERLPGDYGVLERVERIVERLDRLHAGTGLPEDALVVLRSQDSLGGGLLLPPDDNEVVADALTRPEKMSLEDIRTLSLVKLDALGNSTKVESAVAQWVAKYMAEQSTADSVWVLEQTAGENHVAWWRGAIRNGVRAACQQRSPKWSLSIWNWWQDFPGSVSLMNDHLDKASETEWWLAASTPSSASDELVDAIAILCRERDWPILLASTLGSSRPLANCVERLLSEFPKPEVAVEVLLADRSALEIVNTAVITWWPPLVNRAVRCTTADPALLVGTQSGDSLPLVSRHLIEGGVLPKELIGKDFLIRIFDCAAEGNADCLNIFAHLDARAGYELLDHPECETLLSVNREVAQGAAEEWWRRFLAEEDTGRPPQVLVEKVTQLVLARTVNQPVALVIRLLHVFPEFTESDFVAWMQGTDFLWGSDDHNKMGSILVERQWKSATKSLKWSSNQELKIVAWHARELLPWFDNFFSAPDGADAPNRKSSISKVRPQMKVLFLAANPNSSDRLALDEEARAIEEKVRVAKHRDLVELKTRWAVRPEDLQQALLEDEPTVVHFSGHGEEAVGIVLHSANQNEETLVDADSLANLFRVLKDGIRVVVLNACYSEEQARAIIDHIDFVVGMSDSIGDEAARVFAAAFYRGLAFGRSVATAFDLGISELKLLGLGQDVAVPQLLVRSGADENTTLVSGSAT